MGGCCTLVNDYDSRRKKEQYEQKSNQNKNTNLNNSSSFYEDNLNDHRLKILKSGNTREIQKMLDKIKSKEEINKNIFHGNTRNFLIEAVILCDDKDDKIIETLIKKGADINMEEFGTGNTPLFFAASHLKKNFVQKILEYNPNLQHKNDKNQDIFVFMEKYFGGEENMNSKDKELKNSIMKIIAKEATGESI